MIARSGPGPEIIAQPMQNQRDGELRPGWTAQDGLRYLAVALYLAAQIALGYSDSLVTDEPRHLRDGAVMVEQGRSEVSPEHPPLVKLLSAAMIPGKDRRSAVAVASGDPLVADTRFAVAARLAGFPLLRARLAPILISVLGLLAFGSLFRRQSPRAGLIATVLLGASWPYAAHGHYVATDVGPVAFCILACWSIVFFQNTWAGGTLAGIFLAAALLSKFSAPFLVPFVLTFAWTRLRPRPFLLLLAVCGVFALAVESYAVRGMSDRDVAALAQKAFGPGGLAGEQSPASPYLLGVSRSILRVSKPAAVYTIGLLSQSHRSATESGFDYWAGKLVSGAQPLCPVATLLVKNDLPFLLLAAAGFVLAVRRRPIGSAAWIFGAAGLVYLVLAGRSHIHLGVRHLLPLIALLAGLGAWQFERLRPLLPGSALLAAHVVAACLVFPHFVSAKNLVGRLWIGNERLYDVGDDWGQDLGRELREVGGPVAYESLLVYRDPGWRALFPALVPEGSGYRRVIVDRLLLDLRDAARTNPSIPSGAEAEMAMISGWSARIDRPKTNARRIASPEPTFVVYQVGTGN